MRGCRFSTGLASGIGEETKGPTLRDRGVELPQATRRGVARVSKNFISLSSLAFVQCEEIFAAHIHLATYLKYVWCFFWQGFWNSVNSSEICGDIFTSRPVPTGGADLKGAVFVA